MAFVFQTRRTNRPPNTAAVEFPAVRVTIHKGGKGLKGCTRYYYAFNPKAVRLARWVKGDRVLVGADMDKGMMAFKRDNDNGYALAMGEQRQGNTALQVACEPNSDISRLSQQILGKWIPVKESDGMLLCDAFSLHADK